MRDTTHTLDEPSFGDIASILMHKHNEMRLLGEPKDHLHELILRYQDSLCSPEIIPILMQTVELTQDYIKQYAAVCHVVHHVLMNTEIDPMSTSYRTNTRIADFKELYDERFLAKT